MHSSASASMHHRYVVNRARTSARRVPDMPNLLNVSVTLLLLIGRAACRTCEDVKKELATDPGNPWSTSTEAATHCRINLGTANDPLDADQLHAHNITDCIQQCDKKTDCKAVTYGYQSPFKENCWLKYATAPRHTTPETETEVNYVSVFKPDPVYSCVQDPKCFSAYVLGSIGTALGLLSTLLSFVNVVLNMKQHHGDHVSHAHPKAPAAAAPGGKADTDVEAPQPDQGCERPVKVQ